MTPRGGARPGAGRKRLAEKLLAIDEPTAIIRARVPQSYREYLIRVGKGIISVGLRAIIKEHMERINSEGVRIVTDAHREAHEGIRDDSEER